MPMTDADQQTKATSLPSGHRPSKRQKDQRLQSLILDSMAFVGVFYLLHKYPFMFDPFGFQPWQHVVGWLVARGVTGMVDQCAQCFCRYMLQPRETHLLPTRRGANAAKQVYHVPLDTKSVVYMFINSLLEWVFAQNLMAFVSFSPELVPSSWKDMTILNTLGAMVFMLVVINTLFFAPLHHLLHHPWLYPLIHKHHHRQIFPTDGYMDAGNAHPLEHLVLGDLSLAGSILLATLGPTGAHAVTVLLFPGVHAFLSILQHMPYDVEWDLLPGVIHYHSGYHEMHHRKFTINYSAYCYWYDYAMGTYRAYENNENGSSDDQNEGDSISGSHTSSSSSSPSSLDSSNRSKKEA